MIKPVEHHADRRLGVLGCAVVLIAAIVTLSHGATAQQVPTILFSASSYGVTANVGTVVKVGKVAPVNIGSGCGTPEVPEMKTGTAASVSALPLLGTGVINTTAASATNKATSSADVYQLSVLGGLISAQEVKSVSTTTTNSSHQVTSSAAGSKFVNLVVAGQSINALPAPNTTISLAGFGKVVLNEQLASHSSSISRLTVNMIHVYVTLDNVLGVAVGTQIIVSDATSGIELINGPAGLDGMAFGTMVSGKLLSSSPTAEATLACQGSNGIVKTVTLVGVNLSPILTSGTISDTAEGKVSSGGSNSQTSSTIQALNLLSGLVTADVIFAEASGTTTDGMTFNFSSNGAFTNIAVAGHPEISGYIAPNTQVNIAGLGILYLNRVLKTSDSIENRMIELVVKESNTFGLPIGLDIRVAEAEASLHSKTHP